MKEDDKTICFFFTRKQTTFRRAQWNRHPTTVPISKFLYLKIFERSQAPIKTSAFTSSKARNKALKASCLVSQCISVFSCPHQNITCPIRRQGLIVTQCQGRRKKFECMGVRATYLKQGKKEKGWTQVLSVN